MVCAGKWSFSTPEPFFNSLHPWSREGVELGRLQGVFKMDPQSYVPGLGFRTGVPSLNL